VDRSQKEVLVGSLNKTLRDTHLVVVTRHTGLTVAEVTGLRRKIRQAGAGFKVTKNRLARLALKGTRYEGLAPLFTGSTAIAYSADPVAAAKVVVAFAKGNDKLAILGGAMGDLQLDPNAIKALATLPSLDELRAKIIGILQTPATRVVTVLQAPGSQVARVIAAYAAKGEAA
jgi:large subunit ribosomal protein L10